MAGHAGSTSAWASGFMVAGSVAVRTTCLGSHRTTVPEQERNGAMENEESRRMARMVDGMKSHKRGIMRGDLGKEGQWAGGAACHAGGRVPVLHLAPHHRPSRADRRATSGSRLQHVPLPRAMLPREQRFGMHLSKPEATKWFGKLHRVEHHRHTGTAVSRYRLYYPPSSLEP